MSPVAFPITGNSTVQEFVKTITKEDIIQRTRFQ